MDLFRLLAFVPATVAVVLAVYCLARGLVHRSRNEGSDRWGCE